VIANVAVAAIDLGNLIWDDALLDERTGAAVS
jgi:hypothetical protein